MPTIKQLPAAVTVNPSDVLPLGQGGLTRGVTVSALLSGTQGSLILSSGRLLGRASIGSGGVEPIALGAGIGLQGGALTATGSDHATFPLVSELQSEDELVLNSGSTPRRLPATKLRVLFSAGPGVSIDPGGVISATGAGAGIGPQGPAGVTGPTGTQGPAGPQGSAGVAGPTGATGAAGQQGPVGATGAPGAVGPTGPAGALGVAGVAGSRGDTGPAGPQGLAGTPGPTGAGGPAGAPGATGVRGDVGPTGAQGAPGAAGQTGAAGATGPQGTTGPQGAAGPAGATGAQGMTGPQGETGLAGQAGPQGPAGVNIPATATVIGAIKPGLGLAVAGDGTLSLTELSAASATATGASASRLLGDRLADNLGLRDFGAGGYVPGGGGDDLPAFTAALQRLAALGGGRLLVPAGTFKLSGPIVLPSGNVPVHIVGHGDCTVLQPSAVMTSMFVVNGGNVLLADFALVNSGGLAASGLSITKAADNSRCEFDRLTFAGLSKGVWVQNGDVLHFNRPRFTSCGTAFAIDNGMLNSSIAEMYVLGGNGIDIGPSPVLQPEGLHVVGGKILPSTGGSFGVRMKSGLEISFQGLVIDQLAVSGANGFIIDSSFAAVRSIKVTNCWTGVNAVATGTGSGVLLKGAASESIHIDQHTFDSHGSFGLEVDGGTGLLLDLVVTNSRFKSNTVGDVSLKSCRAIFLGCDFRHPTASITTGGTQVQVTGLANRFAASPQLGTVAGGFYAANVGNPNDSLDGQSIGVNLRAPIVAATQLDVSGPAVLRQSLAVQGAATLGPVTSASLDASGASIVRSDLTVMGRVGVGGVLHIAGTGDPEGSVSAPVGSLFTRTDGGPDHLIFGKKAGSGSAGWEPQASQDFVGRQLQSALPSLPASALYAGTGGAGAAQAISIGAGLVINSGVLSVSGTAGSVRMVTGPGAVTVTGADGLIVVNKSVPGPTAVTLEANPVVGVQHRFKDGRGDAAVNPITISPASGAIDGASSFVLSQNRAAVTLEFNGSEWSVT